MDKIMKKHYIYICIAVKNRLTFAQYGIVFHKFRWWRWSSDLSEDHRQQHLWNTVSHCVKISLFLTSSVFTLLSTLFYVNYLIMISVYAYKCIYNYIVHSRLCSVTKGFTYAALQNTAMAIMSDNQSIWSNVLLIYMALHCMQHIHLSTWKFLHDMYIFICTIKSNFIFQLIQT